MIGLEGSPLDLIVLKISKPSAPRPRRPVPEASSVCCKRSGHFTQREPEVLV